MIKETTCYRIKYPVNTNTHSIVTKSNSEATEVQQKYTDGTIFIICDLMVNGVMQEILSRKGLAVKVHNS